MTDVLSANQIPKCQYISRYKTVDRLSVAICGRLTPFFSRNAWTSIFKITAVIVTFVIDNKFY